MVGPHLFLNIIPSNFTTETGRRVWCDWGMSLIVVQAAMWWCGEEFKAGRQAMLAVTFKRQRLFFLFDPQHTSSPPGTRAKVYSCIWILYIYIYMVTICDQTLANIWVEYIPLLVLSYINKRGLWPSIDELVVRNAQDQSLGSFWSLSG